jgi:hypothetical protein
MAQAAAGASALWSGTYKASRASLDADVWPGDTLLLIAPSAGLDAQVVVRAVKVSYLPSLPDLAEYAIAFANDWAETIAMELTDIISPDVYLPQEPETAPNAYLANLNALQVVSISTTSIVVNANITPPANGGFEVRSRDYTFGPSTDEDLVLRSPVPNFTITRSVDEEQFYIRMYDGSKPPLYSRLSSAVFTNVATS